jgi:tetratricopeptide (TPR) repeat protein
VAEGLAHAHARGIIHRDIKPSNLLLDTAGVVWITDFGLAKTQDVALTTTGDVVGTIRYMAPERLKGEGDERGDVYALGLTLYEMLVFRSAFAARDRLELIDRIKTQEPARPRSLDRRIPRDLETIILTATHKEARRRYQSAEAMAEDLRRFLADEPIAARRTSELERLRLWSRRNPALAALLVVLVLVAAASTVTALYLKATLLESEQNRQDALEAKREARLREAEALVGQAHGTRLSKRPGQRFESLAALKKAAAIGRELDQPQDWFNHLRNEAIAALALPDVHITKEFGSFPLGSLWAEVNDDFTLYVRTTDKGDCTIRRVDDDTEVTHLPDLGEPARAQFGMGRILAISAHNSHRFQLWDLSRAVAALRFEKTGIHWFNFRDDGRQIALAHLDGSISVYETASGGCVQKLAPRQIVSRLEVHLHPAAPFVACSSYDFHQGVQVRDLRSGTVVATATPPWPLGSSAGWAPDGRTLFVTDPNGGAIGETIQEYAFDAVAPALRLIRSIQGPNLNGAGITFNPAGDRFVRRGWGHVVVLFDAISGQELFRTHSLAPSSDTLLLRFDRTGQRLGCARVGDRNDRIGLWSVADAREYRSLVHLGSATWGSDVYPPTIHPGGRLAAMPMIDGVALFDLESGRELAHLPINPRGCSVSFDGTGSLLTNTFAGFFRWPVRPDPANSGRLLAGPPERLPFHPGNHPIAASRDGRVIAQCMWGDYGEQDYAGGWILHPNSPTLRRVDAGQALCWCSVSPDGKWVAFGGPHLAAGSSLIHVYEAATAQRVWQSPVNAGYRCRFSSDGQWLVTNTDGGRLYAVGTWEPGPQLGPGTPWDMTTELAILGQTNGTYRLVEPSTGRELTRLEDPELNTGPAVLTPDNTKLVIAAKNGLRVWDLRRIRAELAKLGLDWDAPPLATASASAEAPLSIHVELGDMLSRAQANSLVEQASKHSRAKEHAKALAALRRAVKIDPKCAEAYNNQAWLLLTGPKELRDPAQALPLARKAAELEPKGAISLNTFGVALYYTGQLAEAIPVLERSLREQKGEAEAFDLFFLAMCYHRQGDAAKAEDYHERGKQWFEKHKRKLPANWIEELTAFQAESESVLAQPPGQAKKARTEKEQVKQH